jgi:TPR repeat protein
MGQVTNILREEAQHTSGAASAGSAGMYAAAAGGDGEACHSLGVACSTGAADGRDLVEAHMWFNLGALYGCEEAAWSRADIALEMTRGEIAEAQRRAREWLGSEMRRAA